MDNDHQQSTRISIELIDQDDELVQDYRQDLNEISVSQAAGCPQNVVTIVEVLRTDIPDFRHTFKYEFNTNAVAGCPTVEKMLCTVLLDNMEEFASMEELLEQFELLQVQHRDRKMEVEPDWNETGISTTKFYVDLSKKQQRVQQVQDHGEYRVVLRPKNASAIGSNPRPAGTVQSARPFTPPHRPDHITKEPQLRMDQMDKPVIQHHNKDQTEHRSSVHRYVLSDWVQLGQLYNAHTDNIISGNNFDFPTGNCTNFRSSVRYHIVENLASVEQRLQMFGFGQKISVVSKLAEFGEHNVLGNFLRHLETHGSRASNSFGIVYTSPTKTFELHHDAEQQILLAQQRQQKMGDAPTDGTHTVHAITYGFIVGAIFTVQQPHLEAKDVLKLVLKRLHNDTLTYAESSLLGTLDDVKVMVTVFSNNNGPYDCNRGKQMSLHSALELFEAARRKIKSANINNGFIGHPISCEVRKLTPIFHHTQQQSSKREAAAANLFDRIKKHIGHMEEVERDNMGFQAHMDEFAHCINLIALRRPQH